MNEAHMNEGIKPIYTHTHTYISAALGQVVRNETAPKAKRILHNPVTRMRNSEVIHAVSEGDAQGPFESHDVMSPPWTHNPTATRFDCYYSGSDLLVQYSV